ncbi:Coiled-coil domain-containing protein 162 [Camelus dromedarius]|uniref:Coiled-coil domain-containing protein 162 n=1 Tax=Camelus dromedarius TaxID=9838 RepID=A0A5N4DX08_CAMDR|nr:Coiled-coil domain-containing protein 162 [Camelus dromedarius]
MPLPFQITFSKDHLEACLLSLGCDVMARERSNFESYSMCYEHLLEHARQKLRQKEQELGIMRRGQSPPESSAGQVAELSHNMIMEITALRAQLTDLEEENLNLKKQIRKEVQEEYEALVQALFVTCLHIKEKLDENQLNLIQKVCELIGEVRTEGIDNMKDLKKKWGSARPEEEMKENAAEALGLTAQLSHLLEGMFLMSGFMPFPRKVLGAAFSESEPSKQEQLRVLEQNNSSLAALVCKVRSLGHWRLAVQQARFRGQLRRAEEASDQQELCSTRNFKKTVDDAVVWRLVVKLKIRRRNLSLALLCLGCSQEAMQSKKECLSVKLMAEHEVTLFRQQLLALRQALARAQADNARVCRQQENQAQLLKELEHRATQEARHRQQLDLMKSSSMEKLLEDVEQKEQHLQLLTEEAERASKLDQLQQKKIQRELRQMRSRLAQERSVKVDAFQRVKELQSQLNDAERLLDQVNSPGGKDTPTLYLHLLNTKKEMTMSSYPMWQKMSNFQLFKSKRIHPESHSGLIGNIYPFSKFYFYEHLNE